MLFVSSSKFQLKDGEGRMNASLMFQKRADGASVMVVDDALLQVQHNSSFLNAHYTNSAQYNRVGIFPWCFFQNKVHQNRNPMDLGGTK